MARTQGRYTVQVKTAVAIEKIRELIAEAEQQGLGLRGNSAITSWKSRGESVLTRALSADHHVTKSFVAVQYTPTIAVHSPSIDSSPQYDGVFRHGLAQATQVLKAAIYELELGGTSDDAVDETAFDPDLWAHVQGHIQAEEWQKVASQTAIFVEDRVRQWCNSPKGRNGETLVGKGLFAAVFADAGQYRLGKEPGEWEGWRALGMGFTQALSNVDRHNIQRRTDAKRYAFGVLGIGSLILTQLRYQHGEDLIID
jgi:Protein of unknown function (Hypoth_ymh)